MKISEWIAENKILVFVPLLALMVAVVFLSATMNSGDTANADQKPPTSYPTPTIQTADNPAAPSPAAASAAITESAPGTAKVVFQVEGMSCSGCIATIKSSLAGYGGIQDIIVNIADGTAEVYYDGSKIQDLDQLAASITDSGYPARISHIMTADQLKEEDAIAATRAKIYIASVGGWDIARTDFDAELSYATNRYKKAYGANVFSDGSGKKVRDSIEAQVVMRLINEGIQMQEVQRVGYRIDPKLIDQEFDKLLEQKNIDPEGLKTSLEKSGYPFDYFMRKFENRVLLRHYIENQVLHNAANDYDKQQQYLAWFNNARSLSKVTIYDKRLERLTRSQAAGAGCGSSCKS